MKYFSDYRWLERNKSILCRASFVKELKYILNPRVARIRREEIVGNFLIYKRVLTRFKKEHIFEVFIL